MLKNKYRDLPEYLSERKAFKELKEHFKESDDIECEIYLTNQPIYKRDNSGRLYTEQDLDQLKSNIDYYKTQMLFRDLIILNPILESYNLEPVIWDNYVDSVDKTRNECRFKLNQLYYKIYQEFSLKYWCDCISIMELFA